MLTLVYTRNRLSTRRIFALCVLCWLCLCYPARAQRFSQSSNDTVADREDVEAVKEEQQLCVETPQEFAVAFANREPRCVSRNLIGRVSGGSDASSVYLQLNSKPATFYSGNDALEQYLRTGYPQSFGYFTPSRAATISQPNFPGLVNLSNGYGLLQTIGYDPEYIEIDGVYVLSVFDVRAVNDVVSAQNASAYPFNADIGPIQPTWDALKEYYEWVYDDFDLVIPEDAIEILKNTTFMTLTGCPSRCAYTSLNFPSENMTTPIFSRDREDYRTCPVAEEGTIQVTPTAPDQDSVFCQGYKGREWRPKAATFSAVFTAKYCEPDQSVKAAEILRGALQNSTDSIDQAQWFRAFLVQSCVGNFANLFSGNGFTYTGDSGLLSPTITEYIASPFNVSDLPSDATENIYFCINGLNGGKPDANGTCQIPRIPQREDAISSNASSDVVSPGDSNIFSLILASSLVAFM